MQIKKLSIIVVLVIIAVFIAVFVFFNRESRDIELKEQDSDTLEIIEVRRLYGIARDSFYLETGRIKPNQNLFNVLREYNLAYEQYNNIIKCCDSVFDLRKIRAGNKFIAFLSLDSLFTLKYFVYEHTPVDYLLIDFTDSIHVRMGKKKMKSIRKKSVGTIESSLWNTMKDNNLNPMLAIELSEVFAWSIDFFGLQPKDSFRVIYKEQYIDTASIGIESIYAAYFYHAGKEFYAIPFMQDSTRDFYELDGQSLRKTFLKAPLRYSRISSRYSYSRMHPILKIRRPHLGIDYAAPVGTPIHAIGDGIIIKKGYGKGNGYYLKIKHNSVYTTAYLHLRSFGEGIKQGAYVKQGDIIGYVGSTGLSTGPHLDFRFYKNGSPIDPLKVKAPPVEPVKPENMHQFDSVKRIVVEELNFEK